MGTYIARATLYIDDGMGGQIIEEGTVFTSRRPRGLFWGLVDDQGRHVPDEVAERAIAEGRQAAERASAKGVAELEAAPSAAEAKPAPNPSDQAFSTGDKHVPSKAAKGA